MRLSKVSIEHFRAITRLELPLDPQLTVLVGDNASGKTSVLEAVVLGLGAVLSRMPRLRGVGFRRSDLQRLPAPEARSLWPGVASEARGEILAPYARVALTTDTNISWDRTARRDKTVQPESQALGLRALHEFLARRIEAVQQGRPEELPVFAYYGTDRAVPLVPQRQRNFRKEFERFEALQGGLEAGFRFKEIFEWFMAQEDIERRERERQKDWDYRLPVLEGVRRAIERLLPGCRSPRTELHPLRLVVDCEAGGNSGIECLEIEQLSGGYRTMLAMVMDLARRMGQANPHLGANSLSTTGVVLIDEVDLHLHPRWQQRVLVDLMAVFPKVQFVVTTHSPQVLTTVRPEHIVRLRREGANVVAEQAVSSFGAESGRLLTEILEVEQRPPGEVNEFTKGLHAYTALIEAGEGETEKARKLRSRLDQMSPDDPALVRADLEIRRQRVLRRLEATR